MAFLTGRVVDGSWTQSVRVGEEREVGRDGVRDRGCVLQSAPISHCLILPLILKKTANFLIFAVLKLMEKSFLLRIKIKEQHQKRKIISLEGVDISEEGIRRAFLVGKNEFLTRKYLHPKTMKTLPPRRQGTKEFFFFAAIFMPGKIF